jgi:hypothetical protein
VQKFAGAWIHSLVIELCHQPKRLFWPFALNGRKQNLNTPCHRWIDATARVRHKVFKPAAERCAKWLMIAFEDQVLEHSRNNISVCSMCVLDFGQKPTAIVRPHRIGLPRSSRRASLKAQGSTRPIRLPKTPSEKCADSKIPGALVVPVPRVLSIGYSFLFNYNLVPKRLSYRIEAITFPPTP